MKEKETGTDITPFAFIKVYLPQRLEGEGEGSRMPKSSIKDYKFLLLEFFVTSDRFLPSGKEKKNLK